MKPGDYDSLFSIGELKIKFKPLNYTHINKGNLLQFDLQRNITELQQMEDGEEKNTKSNNLMIEISKENTKMLVNSIEYIMIPSGEQITNPEFIIEFLNNCDKKTNETIRLQIGNLRENSVIKPQKIKCIECSDEYEQPIILNVTDFFD
jgi:hypothetical protein